MIPRAVLVPTPRAVLLLVGCALLALVLAAQVPGAWGAAPVLGLTVLALVVLDAALAGRAEALDLAISTEVEVGEPGWAEVSALFGRGKRSRVLCALAVDPRLMPDGRGGDALRRGDDGIWQARIGFTPTRRGTGPVNRLWLNWVGPLGLGARQVWQDLDTAVRVRPNVAAARSPALQAYLKDAQYGLIARRIRGAGAEFEALADYQPGMDRRRIDWKSSARHAHLFAKEYETERNNQIVFAFDCGQAMCEPVGGLPRIDRAVSAALATSYVALKGGDRVALYGFAARPEVFTPFVADARQFHRLQSEAARLDYNAQEPNFTLALATLAGRLQRRSLIVVFSDFTDPTSAELMIESIGRLTKRHVVLFVTMVDAELDGIATAPPDDVQALAMAVTADALLRQRALVLSRLRQLGVDVIEAPWEKIGMRLLDSYLAIKRKGTIG